MTGLSGMMHLSRQIPATSMVTVVLGEIGVARVHLYRSGQGEPQVHLACFALHGPAVVTQFREVT